VAVDVSVAVGVAVSIGVAVGAGVFVSVGGAVHVSPGRFISMYCPDASYRAKPPVMLAPGLSWKLPVG
jgi:hypothetical protein